MAKALLSFILLLSTMGTYSQSAIRSVNSEQPDYCSYDPFKMKTFIGRRAKILHEGGVYSTLNETNTFKGLPEEWGRKGGQNGWNDYRPKAGDTGTIVHVFIEKGSNRRYSRYIYLLKIGDNYVPVGCSYLTDVDKLDSYERLTQHYLQDSLENIKYASGCKFKLRNVNGNWSRAGRMNIDKVSESFACDLVSKGIDTVMLCKYILDNGASPLEKAFVLWLDHGKGYGKAFFSNLKDQPTEKSVVSFDARPLIDYFFLNRLDTVTTEPQAAIYIDHSFGYSVELQVPSLFFRQRLTEFLIRQNKTHPKAAWWNMIAEKLAAIK
ncbi:MAG TPA: hypothetical protein VHD83_26450 [Puia sp.]|nr:hypothetical protein [Puia sp.]